MTFKRKLKVVVIDDSLLFREVISKALREDPTLDVIGIFSDAVSAIKKLDELKPDVITLDIEMPVMNGIEFLKKVMPTHPIPCVVLSSVNDIVFDALDSGAVDFVAKPVAGGSSNVESILKELIVKVKIASTAKVKGAPSRFAGMQGLRNNTSLHKKVIAMGASTGGTEALVEVIKGFSENMPPIVMVQHMPPVFTNMYAQRLNSISQLEVLEARSGDVVKPGRVLLAPGGRQMKLVKNGSELSVYVFDGEKVSGHAPSVDVLFNSVATTIGRDSIGVILTGMGSDGAKGLLKMRQCGARTIGQNEASCVVYGMPKVAYELGAVEKQVDLKSISNKVIEFLKE